MGVLDSFSEKMLEKTHCLIYVRHQIGERNCQSYKGEAFQFLKILIFSSKVIINPHFFIWYFILAHGAIVKKGQMMKQKENK